MLKLHAAAALHAPVAVAALLSEAAKPRVHWRPVMSRFVPGAVGIAEGSLLSSALLVYMSPLVGLFLIASLFQLLFASDVAALCGAILGRMAGS